MAKPVRYTTTPTQPAAIYGGQLRVDAFDAHGKPAGSAYVDNEEAAAEWFANHVAAQHDEEPGATPEANHTEKDA